MIKGNLKSTVMEDNVPVISLVKKEKHGARTKHLDIKLKHLIEVFNK